MTEGQRKKLIEDFIPYANDLAKKKFYKTPRYVTIEELQSAAYLGLCDAASRAEIIEDFNPYIRIIGEMKEYLRSLNWGKRRHNISASSLEIEIEVEEKVEGDPSYLLENMKGIIGDSVTNIFVSYCLEDKNIREIALELGKTPGRISQIMKDAKIRLKEADLLAA